VVEKAADFLTCLEGVGQKSVSNGTTRFKNVNSYLNTNIYYYLKTSGGQSSKLNLNVVPFFNTSVKYTPVAT
jgi:hypothetical protein